jgi:hypothetical protein
MSIEIFFLLMQRAERLIHACRIRLERKIDTLRLALMIKMLDSDVSSFGLLSVFIHYT